MPRGDGTGPDGKGPKTVNKGWPERNRTGGGTRDGRGLGGGRRGVRSTPKPSEKSKSDK